MGLWPTVLILPLLRCIAPSELPAAPAEVKLVRMNTVDHAAMTLRALEDGTRRIDRQHQADRRKILP